MKDYLKQLFILYCNLIALNSVRKLLSNVESESDVHVLVQTEITYCEPQVTTSTSKLCDHQLLLGPVSQLQLMATYNPYQQCVCVCVCMCVCVCVLFVCVLFVLCFVCVCCVS